MEKNCPPPFLCLAAPVEGGLKISMGEAEQDIGGLQPPQPPSSNALACRCVLYSATMPGPTGGHGTVPLALAYGTC